MSVVEETAEYVGERMQEILSCFKPGVKITVLVRTPGFPDRDFMMTDDQEKEIIAMVKRREEAGRTNVG